MNGATTVLLINLWSTTEQWNVTSDSPIKLHQFTNNIRIIQMCNRINCKVVTTFLIPTLLPIVDGNTGHDHTITYNKGFLALEYTCCHLHSLCSSISFTHILWRINVWHARILFFYSLHPTGNLFVMERYLVKQQWLTRLPYSSQTYLRMNPQRHSVSWVV